MIHNKFLLNIIKYNFYDWDTHKEPIHFKIYAAFDSFKYVYDIFDHIHP